MVMSTNLSYVFIRLNVLKKILNRVRYIQITHEFMCNALRNYSTNFDKMMAYYAQCVKFGSTLNIG